jgi:cob(I)alamin adenosyltransferase
LWKKINEELDKTICEIPINSVNLHSDLTTMSWKIYTKSGDQGETSLIGGSRVPKYNEKVEAYGTIDELKSYLGLIRDLSDDHNVKAWILNIQERLFVAESRVAVDSEEALSKMPNLIENDVLFLENTIDEMNEHLPELTNFILPGGHVLSSHAHVARTICRRAERCTLKAYPENNADNLVIKYLNRLSDFLFVLARKFANDLGKGDVIWKGNS